MAFLVAATNSGMADRSRSQYRSTRLEKVATCIAAAALQNKQHLQWQVSYQERSTKSRLIGAEGTGYIRKPAPTLPELKLWYRHHSKLSTPPDVSGHLG